MRHLIYHCCPLKEHGTWRRSVAHLRARWGLFTGRREISIAVDSMTVDPGEVIDAFGDCDASFRIVGNDKGLGEGVSFPSLLRSVANEPGHTFYCHSKGASYADPELAKDEEERQKLIAIQNWGDVGFHLSLDYHEFVGAALHDHPIAGPFKRVENRMGVDWHYSGTMFWFRNQWNYSAPLTSDRNCVERWPAEHWGSSVAGDLGLSDPRNLYDEISWKGWLTMRFRREILWNAERKAERARCGTKWAELPETDFEPLQVIYSERTN